MGRGKDVVQQVYDGLADGNFLDLLGKLDDHVQWHEPDGYGPPLAGTHHGPVAVVRDVFGQLATRWPGYRLVPVQFIEAGDQVVVLGHAVLTCGDDGESRLGFAHVWRLAGDRIVDVRVFTDTALAMGRIAGTGPSDSDPGPAILAFRPSAPAAAGEPAARPHRLEA